MTREAADRSKILAAALALAVVGAGQAAEQAPGSPTGGSSTAGVFAPVKDARKRAITADTALRLGRYFGTSPEFWVNLQKTYELDLARRQIGQAIKDIPQRPAAAALL